MSETNKPGVCIAVTGLNAGDNPGAGIAVIRAIKEEWGNDVRIIGLYYESLEPGIYMRDLIDKAYQIPYPTEGTASLYDRLLYIHQQEDLKVIIPNFDAELHNFIKLEPALKQLGIVAILPSLEQLNVRDKTNLYDFGIKNNFHVPADYKLFTDADVDNAVHELGFPLVIKGKFYDAYVVYSQQAALKSFYQLGAAWGYPVIAQQYVKGTEINIAGLGDGNGNNVSAVPMRKLYLTEKGKAWAGVTIEDEALMTLAEDFVHATKWKSGYELEIIRDGDGKLWIIEINPRFPAWIYLSVAAGQNQPAALVKMALGEKLPLNKDYQSGKLFIRHSWDEIIDLTDFQKIASLGEL